MNAACINAVLLRMEIAVYAVGAIIVVGVLSCASAVPVASPSLLSPSSPRFDLTCCCGCPAVVSVQVIPVLLSLVEGISSVRLYIPQDLRHKENRKSTGDQLALLSTGRIRGLFFCVCL